MASRPAFTRKNLDLSDPRQMELVRNRAVTDLYEPGSVFKLVTVAAAIEAGKVNPNTTYLDTGLIEVGEREFKNWDLSANGPTSVTRILVRSLNTGTVWIAHKVLGPTLFYQFVRAFGFGDTSGVDIEGEAAGMYRDPNAENWYRADLASNSFGQGISVTPLQVVNMVSAIANGGNLMRPYVVQETRGRDAVERTRPKVIRRAISEETSRTMRDMMREVVDANNFARVPGYSAGGKSGTAYVPTVSTGTRGDAYAEEVTIPSYLGFAPLQDPRISILVKLDNLSTSDFGGVLTAPVFSRLAHDILTYLRVPPDRPDTLTLGPRIGG
ncbi:MAG: penicillin-binding transpeptidase domain-containing protein [Dehalococcoidia bacterium]